MPDDMAPQEATPPTAVICSGVPRQRYPVPLSGTEDHDVEDWLSSYERVSAHNKWNDADKLTNVIFYFSDVALLWFRNHEVDVAN